MATDKSVGVSQGRWAVPDPRYGDRGMVGRRSSNSVFRRLEKHAGSAEAPRVAAVRNRLPAFGESAADVFLLPSQEGASDSRRSSRRAARLSPSHGAPRALPIAREVQRWSFRADEW